MKLSITELHQKFDCEPKCDLANIYPEVPPCLSAADQQKCSLSITAWNDIGHLSKCLFHKKFIRYNPYKVTRQKYKEGNISSVFEIQKWSMNKEIREEVKIMTTEDLIGSVGGSLGMFFGLSISATVLYFIETLIFKLSIFFGKNY